MWISRTGGAGWDGVGCGAVEGVQVLVTELHPHCRGGSAQELVSGLGLQGRGDCPCPGALAPSPVLYLYSCPTTRTFVFLQDVAAGAVVGRGQDWLRPLDSASPCAGLGGRLGRSHPLGWCPRRRILQKGVVCSLPFTQDSLALQGGLSQHCGLCPPRVVGLPCSSRLASVEWRPCLYLLSRPCPR